MEAVKVPEGRRVLSEKTSPKFGNTHLRLVFLTSKSRNVISTISSWLPMNVYNKQSILGGYGFGKSGLLKLPLSLP